MSGEGELVQSNKMTKKRPPPLMPITFVSVLLVIVDAIWIILLLLPTALISFLKNIFFTPKKDLNGKTVLITGAGNGLGREMALQLSKQGCTIICVDILQEDNKRTVSKIVENKGSGRAYYCDVSNPEEVKALSEVVLDDYGKVDILINNAGLIFRNGVLTGTVEEITRVVHVNFLSNIWMIRAFLPHMIANKGGHIVCIASAAGVHSLAQGNVYSCTKFALLGMMYSTIEEFRKNNKFKNIKVSCALPYFIDTNKQYSMHWNLRLPPLTTQKAARLIIEGIRREYNFFTVPWIAFGYNMTSALRLTPLKLYYKIRDKFYADFSEEVKTETKL